MTVPEQFGKQHGNFASLNLPALTPQTHTHVVHVGSHIPGVDKVSQQSCHLLAAGIGLHMISK